MRTTADKKEPRKVTMSSGDEGKGKTCGMIPETFVRENMLQDFKKSTPSSLLVGVETTSIVGTLFLKSMHHGKIN